MSEAKMNDAQVFEKLLDYAKTRYDGHFTICRFTTNWRVGFYTPNSRRDIAGLWVGKTFVEAATAALEASDRREHERPRPDRCTVCGGEFDPTVDDDDLVCLVCQSDSRSNIWRELAEAAEQAQLDDPPPR